MPLKKNNLDQQLQHARSALDNRVKALDDKGVSEKDRRRDPEWRKLRAKCRAISRRIQAAEGVTALDEELKQRKAAKAAAAEAPPEAPAKKGKKDKKSSKEKSKKKKD